MKDNIAAQVLDRLLGWDKDDPDPRLGRLQALAEWKLDDYEGFRAGQRFLESLARWLQEFDTPEARLRWVDFVLDQLIFLSRPEMDQAISTVYPTFVRPLMLARAAAATGIPTHRTSAIATTADFQVALRRTLVIGLSDGARLDVLRRSSPNLSHEQFCLTTLPADEQQMKLTAALSKALEKHGHDGPSTFEHVLLVDDFYGSGTSLIDLDETEHVKKKSKFGQFLTQAERGFVDSSDGDSVKHLLEPEFTGTIVIYAASTRAVEHIRGCLEATGLSERFDIWVPQPIPAAALVDDEVLLQDCDRFWDPALKDEHKGDCPRGYKDCRLPVVLQHNAPNNSVSPLWADSTDRDGLQRRALFPRYERHHADRP